MILKLSQSLQLLIQPEPKATGMQTARRQIAEKWQSIAGNHSILVDSTSFFQRLRKRYSHFLTEKLSRFLLKKLARPNSGIGPAHRLGIPR